MHESMNQDIIRELQVAYQMELETVHNYLSNSIHLDGVRAEEIKRALAEDVPQELDHARRLGERIKTIGGPLPGSFQFRPSQESLQPPTDTLDVVAVIQGVLDAENAAIAQYRKLIGLCEGVDPVTEHLCVEALADEEAHRREFEGFLKEYQSASSLA